MKWVFLELEDLFYLEEKIYLLNKMSKHVFFIIFIVILTNIFVKNYNNIIRENNPNIVKKYE